MTSGSNLLHDDDFSPETTYAGLTGPVQLEIEPRILKQGDMFAIFNPYGDMVASQQGEDGLFYRDTRHLSRYELRIGSTRPLLLSSTVVRDDIQLTVDLTNPDFGQPGERQIPRERLHISRHLFLWQGSCLERMRIVNYGAETANFSLQIIFDADFRDMFEVRGARRLRRGAMLPSEVMDDGVVMRYRGLDDQLRSTRISFSPAPQQCTPTFASYTVSLEPGARISLFVTVSCNSETLTGDDSYFASCLREARQALREKRSGTAALYSSNELFNEWLNRSAADLNLLVTRTEHGYYPYAGIPWFSTAFGRDGLITALFSLWLNPLLARGVLSYLAAMQASTTDPAREAEPGRILHETRQGEMAMLGEVPFRCYYGTVDAAPLFVMLAGAYYERSGDRAFIESIWSNITAALDWIDQYGDIDNDGFVEYAQHTPTGLINLGWKDSNDSIFYADGSYAQGPIALCEVQAYVYAAKCYAADLADMLGHDDYAVRLRTQAAALQSRFEEQFWCDELATYALALDGDKRPCRVRSSNAGHVLFGGIASAERARQVADTLMAPGSCTRWGIRTLDAAERRYNPMSYHNGTIWPHDNALIALGFARYGLSESSRLLMTRLFDSALFMDAYRLPELFCGFDRAASEGPIRYPMACAPQAWASASVFAMLAACLRISFDGSTGKIYFRQPSLPPFMKKLQINNLTIGQSTIDLLCERNNDHDVLISVTRRSEQPADVIILQ